MQHPTELKWRVRQSVTAGRRLLYFRSQTLVSHLEVFPSQYVPLRRFTLFCIFFAAAAAACNVS